MIAIHRLTPDDWCRWRTLRLDALREAPHAFSSSLDEWQGAGDLEARWRHRLTAVPFNVIASIDNFDAGMSSGSLQNNGSIELISMWVAPFARRQGLAGALIDAVIGWASAERASRIELAVFSNNAPAIALYRRHGFVDCGVVEGFGPARTEERRMVRERG
jgi:ribosomal protein S18 acetylase RimI-like enzyme